MLSRLQLPELESGRRFRSECLSNRLKRLKINKGLLRDCAKNVLQKHWRLGHQETRQVRETKGLRVAPAGKIAKS